MNTITYSNSNSQNFQCLSHLKIDQSAAIAHLKALGYEDGESVYLRAIANNGAQGRATKLEIKFPQLPWDKLESFQHGGKGIYFVVNGGGHKDADVVRCKAIFYEHDDLPKEQQLVLWQVLDLPQPTIQVDTGGKSIHSYWRVHCDVSQWRALQADLLEYADADRSLKNPSRVMRLAGSWHIKASQQSTIIERG